jgi:hypothetical protein
MCPYRGEYWICLVATFLIGSDAMVYHSDMTSESNFRLATSDEIATTLSFALRYDGRKRVHHADEAMARLRRSGL